MSFYAVDRFSGTASNSTSPTGGIIPTSLACTLRSIKGRFLIHLILNPYWEALEFELPPTGDSPASGWHRWIDTSLDSPEDLCEWASAPVLTGASYLVQPRSVVVLFARLLNEAGERVMR